MTAQLMSRERLQELAAGQSGFNLRTATHEESQELASMALAAIDSEPVAWLWSRDGDDERDVSLTPPEVDDDAADAIECGWTATPLYRHAQPAPVVPNGLRLALSNAGIAAPESDEMLAATCEKHIQALVTWVKDRKPFQSAPVVPSFEEWLSAANRKPLGWVKDAMREAYDACRAAMLQAGNSPVIPDGSQAMLRRWLAFGRGMQNTGCQLPHNLIAETEAMLAAAPQLPGSETAAAPGKWIPVSERMPEKNQNVLISVNFDSDLVEPLICSARYTGSTFRRGDVTVKPGAGIEEATHWMPLPAAPQEVKGE
ncbi:DUF551 domain-containing protein [Klebsiella michiganensis]|uniref:DUF551 domain-containing protein n=1 Tax=Klebsiella michiganensis TaxID=1134687 RepID=UPI0035D8492B